MAFRSASAVERTASGRLGRERPSKGSSSPDRQASRFRHRVRRTRSRLTCHYATARSELAGRDPRRKKISARLRHALPVRVDLELTRSRGRVRAFNQNVRIRLAELRCGGMSPLRRKLPCGWRASCAADGSKRRLLLGEEPPHQHRRGDRQYYRKERRDRSPVSRARHFPFKSGD
jgi:hypothetical protein